MSHRGLWLHARVIPAAFPSGKTCHISGTVNVNLEWTRISDDRRPRAWKHGDRCMDVVINPFVSPMRCQKGQGQEEEEEVPEQGPLASRQGHPSSVPKRKPLPLLEGRERGLDPEGTWIRASRGSRDHRELNAAINLGNLVILIKPPAQRRMGGKRRLVDQDLWLNAGVIVVPARFSCCMTLDICDTGTAKFDR